KNLADIVYAISAPYLLHTECLSQLNPEDMVAGHLIKLADRAHETGCAALALCALGQLREAEILSRALFESAATLTFIVQKNTRVRIIQFFKEFIEQKRDQNRKWKNDLRDAAPDIQSDHNRRIFEKCADLDHYEGIVNGLASHYGLDTGAIGKFPPLIERLTALGRRLEYRTVYAAMCSQAHHDAEDVLNFFLANGLGLPDAIHEEVERKADAFAIFMTLFGARWFIEAMIALGSYLDFPTVVHQSRVSLARLDAELELVAACLPENTLPSGWKQMGAPS
ncbi:MAG: DUF5677 domain-containing protein, partial [Fimbriimonadaceae bacterium]